jgi:hypothetical protein
MSFIKNILGKPFLLLLTIILLWFFTLLLKVNSNKFYGILAAFTAVSFLASFIFIVIQKKWFNVNSCDVDPPFLHVDPPTVFRS